MLYYYHNHRHLTFILSVCISSWFINSIAYGWVIILPGGGRSLGTRSIKNWASISISTPSEETITIKEQQDDDTFSDTADNNSNNDNNNNNAWSHEEFQSWFYQQLVDEAGPVLHQTYGDALLVDLSKCVTKWRQRYQLGFTTNNSSATTTSSSSSSSDHGDSGLWKRLFKRDRVVKEVVESIPIIHAIDNYVRSLPALQEDKNKKKITILDLCSGKGYLSMILSEYLPPDKVAKLVLIDKAWPMCHAEPKPHHMNWDHIYGNYTTTTTSITNEEEEEEGSLQQQKKTITETSSKSYFTTWPIPLHTSKQNLKKSSDMRRLQQRLMGDADISAGPCFVLGVHLCGTLSIQAVQMFYSVPTIQGLILKPCCLPGMAYVKQKQAQQFQAGRHAFPTKEVCAPGYWKNKQWEGPPRWHLQGKFDAWCGHLYEGMKHVSSNHDDVVGVRTKLLHAPVQTSGGFQNTFLFAQKEPISDGMWDEIENVELKLRQLLLEEEEQQH